VRSQSIRESKSALRAVTARWGAPCQLPRRVSAPREEVGIVCDRHDRLGGRSLVAGTLVERLDDAGADRVAEVALGTGYGRIEIKPPERVEGRAADIEDHKSA